MNKFFIIVAAGLLLTACGNSAKDADAQRADSIEAQRIADSTAAAEQAAEQARQDSIAEASFNNAITLSKGKKKISDTYPPSESFNITLPVTLTNNTDIEILPDDYIITYTERLEDSEGGFSNTPRTLTGPAIAPGGSNSVTIYGQNITDIVNVKVKKKITADEFKARRAQK